MKFIKKDFSVAYDPLKVYKIITHIPSGTWTQVPILYPTKEAVGFLLLALDGHMPIHDEVKTKKKGVLQDFPVSEVRK